MTQIDRSVLVPALSNIATRLRIDSVVADAQGGKGTLGTARYRLKPGKAKRVRAKLTKRGKVLLAEASGPIEVKAKGGSRDSLGNRGKVRGRARLVP